MLLDELNKDQDKTIELLDKINEALGPEEEQTYPDDNMLGGHDKEGEYKDAEV